MLLMVKSMFDLYDVNRNGALSKEEFDVLMDELGYNMEGTDTNWWSITYTTVLVVFSNLLREKNKIISEYIVLMDSLFD